MRLAHPQRGLTALARCVLLAAVVVACGSSVASTAVAFAEGCPGSGPRACPYAAAKIIGRRGEGVLRFPEAVAVDGQGNVYVADQLSFVVQKFSAGGAFETEWGSFGGAHGQFGPIGGLATDAAGNVYVVDSEHNRVQKFDPNGNFLSAWGGRGSELGRFNFGSSRDFTHPPGGGIAVAGNFVYVADSGNNRIERFNLEGGEAIEWGSRGSGPGQFSYPRGVAANEREVLVADDDNHRIEKFDPNGVFQTSVGSQGTGPGQFGFPYGVTLDAAADAYVADDINHRIVKLNPNLSFAGAWGGFGSKAGQLGFPRALASEPGGETFVADTANDRVEVFDPAGNFLRMFGISARGPAQMTGPRGLAIDPSGRLLVSDTVGGRIETFAGGGEAYAGAWSLAGGFRARFSRPSGIGIDLRGSVFVADEGNERLVRLWGDATYLSELGGPADVGGAHLSGAGSVSVAAGSGDAYVADAGHNRVLVYSPEGTLLAKWGAGAGDGTAGNGAGEFNHPSAVAVDGAGDVYVADTYNNRVVKLTAGGGVLGEWGSAGTGDGRFRSPSGVAVDGAGEVYVLDGENNRVELFDANGHFLAKWGQRGPGLGEFSKPVGLAVGCDGAVYVADTFNNRVQRFSPDSPAPSGCLARGSWPPPLDVAPLLHVSLPRSGAVLARRALALAVSCQRACKVLVTATLSPRGRRGAVRLIAAGRALAPALTGHLRLRISPPALHRLRRALGLRRAMTARVSIIAAGPTGRRTFLTRTYAVSR
jgi:DNA-binding beta-propeller fold protein YncE